MATKAPAMSKLLLQPSADDTVLANLGYKQEFFREFTPLEVAGLAFSFIGVVPSITAVLFYAIPNGGTFAMVWGLYYWTYSLASPRCRNFLSWIVGYANTIEFITAIASVNWACAVQITAAISIASGQPYATTNETLYGIYAALVLSHAVLVSLGTKVLARLQKLYTLVNVCLCFIIIIALPIATPPEFRNSASFALGGFTNYHLPPNCEFITNFNPPGGYDASVHMCEEASNAATAIPWAIVRINVSLAFCMGTDLGGILNSPIRPAYGADIVQFVRAESDLGSLVSYYFSAVRFVAYMVASNALLVGSRQTFAFSRDGALPFSRYLYRINGYTKTPVNTVWFDAVCVLAIGLLAFVSTQAIDAVFTIAVTASYISYITPITTRFAFKNDFKPGPFHLGKLSFPIAAIAVTWMVFMIFVFFFPATPQTTAQEMNYTVVVLGGFMFLAISWYYCPVYGGVHWFNGPVANITPAIEGEHRDEDSMSEKKGHRDAEISVDVV
ncbi:amino acid permease-domain-containing protein [Suillus ampliporus]|nr:amino acid permease-domain-containing protein [Suillus ampliporus]